MALQTRPLARAARGDVPVRSEANASAALPRLRLAGGRDGDKMSSMRREYAVLLCRSEQVTWTLDAANFSGNVLRAYDLLPDVYLVYDHHDALAGFRLAGRKSS